MVLVPHQRDYAVSAEGTVIVFECSLGHHYRVDYGQRRISQRLPAWWCARMVSYWGRENGGAPNWKRGTSGKRIYICPECRVTIQPDRRARP